MLRPLRIPLLVLTLCGVSGQVHPFPRPAVQEGAQPQLPATMDWQQMVERDTRISFTRRSGHDARVEINGGELRPLELAAALIAIGCTQPQLVRDRPLLESYAKIGTDLERRAAILALGQFGEGAEAVLLEHLEHPDPSTRDCAMLGLLLTGRRSARERIERSAAQGGEDGQLASNLLVFIVDPGNSNQTDVTKLLLALRWDAARRYGLVDMVSWPTRVLSGLVANQQFLDAVVFGAVADSSELGVKDHLLASLINGGGAPALRAATVAMPEEIAALIESGLWQPRGARAWNLMLEEIEEHQTENKSLTLLGLSLEVPEVEVYALKLIARAGLPEPLVGLEEQWPDLDAHERILACEAWAITGKAEALSFLRGFEEDPDPRVRASILVTESRLGEIDAHARLREILQDPDHEEYGPTLTAALDQADDPLVRTYLEELLPKVEGHDHLRVARVLAQNGVALAREALAEDLRDGFPSGYEGVRCVRALVGRDAAAHLELFHRFFPVEDDLSLNIELARAIISAQDDLALRILRPALWSGDFDRSVLAALVLVRMHGINALRNELNRTPVGISSRDLRRVGFALGEWGGTKEVEYLQQQTGLLPNSPVLQGAILGALGGRTH